MRTHTTTATVCKFEELTPEMQELAIGKNFDINLHYDWWGFTFDAIQEMAEKFGIDTEQKSFCYDLDRGKSFGMDSRLSFSSLRAALDTKPETGYKAQEELHALFSAWYKAAKKVCPQTWKAISEGCSPYATSKARDAGAIFDTEADNNGQCDRVADDLQTFADLCEDVLRHICHWSATLLQREYDYLSSDEAIRETLICNEYEFEPDGDGSIF